MVMKYKMGYSVYIYIHIYICVHKDVHIYINVHIHVQLYKKWETWSSVFIIYYICIYIFMCKP